MDYLIGWKEFKTKFNDDNVTMELLPLTVGATIALSPATKLIASMMDNKKIDKKINDKEINDIDINIDIQNNLLKIQEISEPVLINHLKNMTGFTINGENPTSEILCNNPAFCSFIVEIITELMLRARLKINETKNLKGQSGNTVKENNLPV